MGMILSSGGENLRQEGLLTHYPGFPVTKETHFSHDHAALTTLLGRLLVPQLLAGLLVPRQLAYVSSGALSRPEALFWRCPIVQFKSGSLIDRSPSLPLRLWVSSLLPA
jgi:hypothetical protein